MATTEELERELAALEHIHTAFKQVAARTAPIGAGTTSSRSAGSYRS